MYELLTNPRAFYSRFQTTDVRSPAFVVLATAVASSGSVLIVFLGLLDSLSGSTARFLLVGFGIGVLTSFLSIVATWPLLSAVIHGLARSLGGTGTFRSLTLAIGWGFVPQLFTGLIGTLAMVVVMTRFQSPQSPERVQQFVISLQSHPFIQLSRAATIIGTGWSGVLWYFAVSHVHELDRRRTSLAVGIPVGLLLVWLIFKGL